MRRESSVIGRKTGSDMCTPKPRPARPQSTMLVQHRRHRHCYGKLMLTTLPHAPSPCIMRNGEIAVSRASGVLVGAAGIGEGNSFDIGSAHWRRQGLSLHAGQRLCGGARFRSGHRGRRVFLPAGHEWLWQDHGPQHDCGVRASYVRQRRDCRPGHREPRRGPWGDIPGRRLALSVALGARQRRVRTAHAQAAACRAARAGAPLSRSRRAEGPGPQASGRAVRAA